MGYRKFAVFTTAIALETYALYGKFDHLDLPQSEVCPPDLSRVNVTTVTTATTTTHMVTTSTMPPNW